MGRMGGPFDAITVLQMDAQHLVFVGELGVVVVMRCFRISVRAKQKVVATSGTA